MNMSMNWVWLLSFSILTVSVAGCGGAKGPKLPDPVPAKGTVLMDDKPLANAQVHFIPAGLKAVGPGSVATTDASGNYELKTMISGKLKPGSIPGEYNVWISCMVGPDGKPHVQDAKMPAMMAGVGGAAKELVPIRYSNATMSSLKGAVAAKGGTNDFKLSSSNPRLIEKK